MILPIVKYGSATLRKKAFDIDKEDSFLDLAANMFSTLKQAEGIGLAGPQVGVLKNIFIIDTSPLEKNGVEVVEKAFYNPVILHFNENPVYYNEGCLSIPGVNEDIIRPDKIEVRYRDGHFDWKEEVLDGLVARIFQHEYDHLQGVLFVDRISPIRKKLIKSKLREIARNTHK